MSYRKIKKHIWKKKYIKVSYPESSLESCLSICLSTYPQTCGHGNSSHGFRACCLTWTWSAESFLVSFKCLDALACFQRLQRISAALTLLLLRSLSQKRNVLGSADTFMTKELQVYPRPVRISELGSYLNFISSNQARGKEMTHCALLCPSAPEARRGR